MKKINILLSVLIIIILFCISGFAIAGEIIITPPDDAHTYVMSEIKSNNVNYICIDCNESISVKKSKIKELWDENYINKSINDTDVDDSCFLDLNRDGTINSKDYSIINKF